VQFIRAQLAREDDPWAARELLSGVVDTYTALKSNRHLAAALYETSIVARATGDQAGARASIDRAIDAIERQSRTFESTEVRASFTETVENVFDAMMDFELARGAPDSAFAYLERGRVAAWTAAPGPSEVSTSRAASLTVDDVRAVLPDSTALIEYAVLNDLAIVWTVSKSGSRNHVVSIRRDSIAALVERALDESGSATVDSAGSLARLFDLLMKPVLEDLPGVNRLAIVPDRELGRLPFAALWDRRSARYVVESYQVRTLPSAAFFVSVAGPSRRSSSGAHALVVGDPTSDTSLTPRLPALPGALREAGRVAELYRKHRLLRGTEASRASVLDQLGASSVFHFAGHAIANGDQPELSYLALATTGADDGTLRGSEIGKLRLSNLELVVLSACSTLNPRSSHTGAIAGLAYSFLRAGAPATISTLWDVTDDVTTDLLVAFHGGFVGGASAAEALRQAQLVSLRSARPELRAPRAWGAFIYTGP
jgi:CHAT domain-containing protein